MEKKGEMMETGMEKKERVETGVEKRIEKREG